MNIQQALDTLGVREDTLTSAEKEQLDRDGYLPLRGILSPEHVEAIRRRQAALLAEEGEDAGKEVQQEAGSDCLSDLINKGTVFHIVLMQPRVLAAVAHVLNGDLKLSSLNSRAPHRGNGQQWLHPDWDRLETPGDYQVCNSLWLLDDFMPENGATRIVPGTHLTTKIPSDEMADPSAPHPREILLLGTAGDVVVFNAHTWHGGTRNRTDRPRRAMHGYFCRRHQPPQLDQQRYLRRATWDQISPAARVVLGVTQPTQE